MLWGKTQGIRKGRKHSVHILSLLRLGKQIHSLSVTSPGFVHPDLHSGSHLSWFHPLSRHKATCPLCTRQPPRGLKTGTMTLRLSSDCTPHRWTCPQSWVTPPCPGVLQLGDILPHGGTRARIGGLQLAASVHIRTELPAGASTCAHLVGALSHQLQGGVLATVRQKLHGAQNL